MSDSNYTHESFPTVETAHAGAVNVFQQVDVVEHQVLRQLFQVEAGKQEVHLEGEKVSGAKIQQIYCRTHLDAAVPQLDGRHKGALGGLCEQEVSDADHPVPMPAYAQFSDVLVAAQDVVEGGEEVFALNVMRGADQGVNVAA